MSGFGDGLKSFSLKVEATTRLAFANIVSATYESITLGSPVTGSPGTQVDTSYYRTSWQIGWNADPSYRLSGEGPEKDPAWNGAPLRGPVAFPPASTAITYAVIGTNCVYGPGLEDGVMQLGSRRGNVTGHTAQRIVQRSRVGGPHHVALTVAGFDRIVATEVAKIGGRS